MKELRTPESTLVLSVLTDVSWSGFHAEVNLRKILFKLLANFLYCLDKKPSAHPQTIAEGVRRVRELLQLVT